MGGDLDNPEHDRDRSVQAGDGLKLGARQNKIRDSSGHADGRLGDRIIGPDVKQDDGDRQEPDSSGVLGCDEHRVSGPPVPGGCGS